MNSAKAVLITACPACRIKFTRKGDSLFCPGCGAEYRIINGVPHIIPLASLKGISAKLELIDELEKGSLIRKFFPSGTFLNNLAHKIYEPELFVDLAKKRLLRLIKEAGPGALILDLGSGPARIGPETINFDITPFKNVDIVGDGLILPFQNGTFDLVISRAVIEHVEAPEKLIGEIHRVLKDGGIVYLDAPFLQIKHAPLDYTRYTDRGLENLMGRRFLKLETGIRFGPQAALARFLREYATLFTRVRILSKLFKLTVSWALYPFKFLDHLLGRCGQAARLSYHLYYIGRKTID